jgi:hypothetical protein
MTGLRYYVAEVGTGWGVFDSSKPVGGDGPLVHRFARVAYYSAREYGSSGQAAFDAAGNAAAEYAADLNARAGAAAEAPVAPREVDGGWLDRVNAEYEQLPAEQRARYEASLRRLAAGQNPLDDPEARDA